MCIRDRDRIALFLDNLIKIQTLEEAYKVNGIFAPKTARICYNAMISISQNNSAEKNLSLLKELISEKSNILVVCGNSVSYTHLHQICSGM